MKQRRTSRSRAGARRCSLNCPPVSEGACRVPLGLLCQHRTLLWHWQATYVGRLCVVVRGSGGTAVQRQPAVRRFPTCVCPAALRLPLPAAGFGLTVGFTEMDSVVVLETTQAVNSFLEKQVRCLGGCGRVKHLVGGGAAPQGRLSAGSATGRRGAVAGQQHTPPSQPCATALPWLPPTAAGGDGCRRDRRAGLARRGAARQHAGACMSIWLLAVGCWLHVACCSYRWARKAANSEGGAETSRAGCACGAHRTASAWGLSETTACMCGAPHSSCLVAFCLAVSRRCRAAIPRAARRIRCVCLSSPRTLA